MVSSFLSPVKHVALSPLARNVVSTSMAPILSPIVHEPLDHFGLVLVLKTILASSRKCSLSLTFYILLTPNYFDDRGNMHLIHI